MTELNKMSMVLRTFSVVQKFKCLNHTENMCSVFSDYTCLTTNMNPAKISLNFIWMGISPHESNSLGYRRYICMKFIFFILVLKENQKITTCILSVTNKLLYNEISLFIDI